MVVLALLKAFVIKIKKKNNMGLGIIGRVLSKKQHVYSSKKIKDEDKNADENPGYTQWRSDNKKMDDNAKTLAEFKKIQADKKGDALESDS